MPIRIVLGEDSLLVREGVHRLLAVDPDVEVVGAAADEGSLRQSCEERAARRRAHRHPDAAHRHRRGHPRSPPTLRESHPDIGVVILSQYADPTYALALLERGSDGRAYLLKERVHDRAELMAAIRAVADGGSVIDPKVVEALVNARSRARELAAQRADRRASARCSPRSPSGKSNSAIAESLFLTKRAVEKHINAIFLKLGLRGRGRRQQAREGDADVPRGRHAAGRPVGLRTRRGAATTRGCVAVCG